MFSHEQTDPEAKGVRQGSNPSMVISAVFEWITKLTSPKLYFPHRKRKRETFDRFANIPFPMTNPPYALILAGGSGQRFCH
jgi:hypothetical protein